MWAPFRSFVFRWCLACVVLVTGVFASTQVIPQASQLSSRPADALTLRIIVVGSEDEAQRVVDQLRNGDNFVALARRISQDPSADNGGLLGRVAVSSLRPELREALQGLAVGQLSRVVKIPTGFAVLKVMPDDDEDVSVATRALLATGSVKWVTDVAGFSEASVVLQQFEKPAGWNVNPRTTCQTRTDSLAATERALERDLSSGALLALP